MSSYVVVGIDVGEEAKGFHAVALADGHFVGRTISPDPAQLTEWCINQSAVVVAVDAPCGWSMSGMSRLAEVELRREGINCFSTPTRDRAKNRGFYKWVFNGERMYQNLQHHYQLFDGEQTTRPMCIETFPHAIVCALRGQVVAARPKVKVRRKVLRDLEYDDSSLPNIDFVDAALCAVVADRFQHDRVKLYGGPEEGIIVVPLPSPLDDTRPERNFTR